jgi:ABC-type oligopeptide transport system substrate-binding subunit
MDGGDFTDALFGADSINPLRIQNNDLDSLILTVNRSNDNAVRQTALLAIEHILLSEGTILPLTSIVDYAAAGDKLTEISMSPGSIIHLNKVILSK